jgi:hypothetical protein
MTDMVSSYLERVEPARREVVAATAALVRAHLPSGFVEAEAYGMPTWIVPPSVKPATYNGQPLGVVALASQKGHVALYLMGLYAVPEARAAFEVAFDVLAAGLRAVGPEALVEAHDHAHAGRKLKPVPGVGGAASAVKTAKATKTAKTAKTAKAAKTTKTAKVTKATKATKTVKAAKTTKATKAAKTAKAARHA